MKLFLFPPEGLFDPAFFAVDAAHEEMAGKGSRGRVGRVEDCGEVCLGDFGAF